VCHEARPGGNPREGASELTRREKNSISGARERESHLGSFIITVQDWSPKK